MTQVPLATSLLVAAIGMVIVFLAMGLIYASMRLLTAVATGKSCDDSAGAPHLALQDRTENTPNSRRAAAIAVALARAELSHRSEVTGLTPASSSGRATAWQGYHRGRQLRPGGRGRIAQ
jgi:Na+-transporting methylmalonyl-CoA/oxaloacetate decarboxylase gamma subunit